MILIQAPVEYLQPEEVGKAIMAAQKAIHTVPAGWPLSAALAEFGSIMETWAQHPPMRNWNLISDIDKFIARINKRNRPTDEVTK